MIYGLIPKGFSYLVGKTGTVLATEYIMRPLKCYINGHLHKKILDIKPPVKSTGVGISKLDR